MNVSRPGRGSGAALLAAVLLAGCSSSDPADTGPGDDVQIRFHITGGIAGVDYAILVDGPAGVVLGESCGNGCSFQSGEVIVAVTDEQVRAWADQLLDAGILALDGRDYGDDCCDRFHVELSYADGLSQAAVRGAVDLMPAGIQSVAADLAGLIHQTLSIIVDPDLDPGTLPSDPVQLLAVGIGSTTLDVSLVHSGGCGMHAFALVSDGTFMESWPVQARLVLAHDDRDDPCDSLVQEDIEFRLYPLEAAYAAAYPGEEPGERRMVIHVTAPGSETRSVEHTF